MTVFVLLACLGGMLVGLSRQLNGRLSISTTPLIASFWNHAVGFVVLTCLGLFVGGLLPAGAAEAPWYIYLGGPIGVIFVAAGSWAIARIGAVNSALLIIGGQMVTGVAFDYARAVPASFSANAAGIVLIVGGMIVSRGRRKVDGSQ
ncbi:DMT family transporter (plasmid) [Rhizobium sp. Pop5]|uniref:DMT family transporter n=1 Tax=Rhizobium sp. Pop5 TaxID=1223565 RepID=UPI000283904B|nr:DMT family transporter [Rhizobium sp. Pop5]EJZ16663.1 putative transmembrane protein [Rhizobium sp. Pop5]UVD59310.1 DMT family transporter [Rhizobium sp. Pop5]